MKSQSFSALISSGWEKFQVCFNAVHYLKISEQPDSELKSADFLWNGAHFWQIQNDKNWLLFQLFEIFRNASILRHIIQIINLICEKVKNENTKIYFFNLLAGRRRHKKPNNWVFCYCPSNKTDIDQILTNIFSFSWMNFQDYFKKLRFRRNFTEY